MNGTPDDDSIFDKRNVKELEKQMSFMNEHEGREVHYLSIEQIGKYEQELYSIREQLASERALRKELVQSLENLFVFHQRVRFPYELSYEKAIMNSVESILQKSKSLDEKK